MVPEIVLRNVTVEYSRLDRLRRVQSTIRALDQVSLTIPESAMIGIAGSSGCGKSTLARCIAGWQQPSSGEIISHAAVQLVMQDAGASLNPRFSAFEAVEEPLRIRGLQTGSGQRVSRLLDTFGIAGGNRRAGEFSGGERARLAIARALVAMPETGHGLLILDESLSSLDLATREHILGILFELRKRQRLSCIFISHDLDMLARVVSDLVILHEGRIIEHGAPREILETPRHHFTALPPECMLTGK